MMHPVLANANPFKTSAVASHTAETATAATVNASDRDGAVMAGPIPSGYVLVERELLGRVLKRLKHAAAVEREQLRERMVTLLARAMQ
jgi:hypothetical protein